MRGKTEEKTAERGCLEAKAAVGRKKEARKKFDDYVRMIRKASWYYSKKFCMDYSDIEAQGFLIYCMAIQTFHREKASFSTYLHQNLYGRLLDYCNLKKEERCRNGIEEALLTDLLPTDSLNESINMDIFSARKQGLTLNGCLECANKHLSLDAYDIFSWLLLRQWEDGEIMAHFVRIEALYLFSGVRKWEPERVHNAWAEIGDFWHSGLLEKSPA